MLRIGVGAGFSGDRIEPAVDLVERGNLDYIAFECLAERTIALAQQERQRDPERGYDPLLEERIRAVLPAAKRTGCRIITNMGAANPTAGARRVTAIARELGLKIKVAALLGDDVLDLMQAGAGEPPLPPDLRDRLVSANVYLGARELRRALATGADVVISGRVTDSALFLAPAAQHYGWAEDDWARQGRGVLLGHLLECGPQLSGGYYMDPLLCPVPNPADLGFPLAEVAADGSFCVTKLPGTGGIVSVETCTEQLLYEIGDPSTYLTPDVTADFSAVSLEAAGPDRVLVSGGKGRTAPPTLKVLACYEDGFIGEGEISYAGFGALERAQLAGEIVRERLARTSIPLGELRIDLLGVNGLHDALSPASAPYEVRLRVAGRTADARAARAVGQEVEALYTAGPAGGGGVRKLVRQVAGVASTYLRRELIESRIAVVEVTD
jgi:hypothetical protein